VKDIVRAELACQKTFRSESKPLDYTAARGFELEITSGNRGYTIE
jgi:hypothetical protein